MAETVIQCIEYQNVALFASTLRFFFSVGFAELVLLLINNKGNRLEEVIVTMSLVQNYETSISFSLDRIFPNRKLYSCIAILLIVKDFLGIILV